MAVSLTPFTKSQWFDSNGKPLAAGKLFTYAAGTTTPQASYTDSTGSTPNANPVILDAGGFADVWLTTGLLYKLVMQNSAGSQIWSEDNINPGAIPASLGATNITGNLTLQQSTAATSSANQSSNIFEIDANYWNGSASALDKWTLQDVLGTGTNPTATLTVQHSGSSGVATFNLPGSLTVGTTFKAGDGFGAVNVKAFGVKDDCSSAPTCVGATDNSTALAAAITYACAQANPPVIEFPATNGIYYWNTNQSIGCDELQIRGIGYAKVYCPNGCFTNSGHRHVNIDHLFMQGNNVAAVYAITHTTNVASALNCHYHHNVIIGFGNTAAGTGGGIGIQSDSANLQIGPANHLFNEVADINISAPTDTADIYDNLMGAQSGQTCRALDATGGTGSNTVYFRHNNLTAEGLGCFRINSAATWFVYENECETSQTIVNASNASVEFLAGGGQIFAVGNTVNPHSATGATYAFYVADGLVGTFMNNTPSGYNTNGFRVGNGYGSVYWNNFPTSGFNTLYSADYVGIFQPGNNNTGINSIAFGCSSPDAVAAAEFCFPSIYNKASGTASTNNVQAYTPSLANGNTAAVVVGAANSTNNAAFLLFNNVGGAGSASNTAQISLVNGTAVSVSNTGKFTAPGGLLAGASGTGLTQTAQIQNGGSAAITVPTSGGGQFLTTTNINGVTAVGNGAPAEAYNTAAPASHASVGATTMITPAGTGNYRFSYYITQTVIGSSCAGNTTVQVAIVYQDTNAAAGQTVNLGLHTITTNGTIGVVPWTSGPTTWTFTSGAHAIQFQTTFTAGGSCSPAPTVQITPILEAF